MCALSQLCCSDSRVFVNLFDDLLCEIEVADVEMKSQTVVDDDDLLGNSFERDDLM